MGGEVWPILIFDKAGAHDELMARRGLYFCFSRQQSTI